MRRKNTKHCSVCDTSTATTCDGESTPNKSALVFEPVGTPTPSTHIKQDSVYNTGNTISLKPRII